MTIHIIFRWCTIHPAHQALINMQCIYIIFSNVLYIDTEEWGCWEGGDVSSSKALALRQPQAPFIAALIYLHRSHNNLLVCTMFSPHTSPGPLCQLMLGLGADRVCAHTHTYNAGLLIFFERCGWAALSGLAPWVKHRIGSGCAAPKPSLVTILYPCRFVILIWTISPVFSSIMSPLASFSSNLYCFVSCSQGEILWWIKDRHQFVKKIQKN